VKNKTDVSNFEFGIKLEERIIF